MQEAPNRLLKELLKEAKALAPGDRVLIVGTSREPWLAAKKDEKAFLGFWSKALHLPLPDYASRRVGRARCSGMGRGGEGAGRGTSPGAIGEREPRCLLGAVEEDAACP